MASAGQFTLAGLYFSTMKAGLTIPCKTDRLSVNRFYKSLQFVFVKAQRLVVLLECSTSYIKVHLIHAFKSPSR